MNGSRLLAVGGLAAVVGASASAQSLYTQVQPAAPPDREAELQTEPTDGTPSLQSVSLYAVEPPEPRSFQTEDLITIIISERTNSESTQTLETEKRTQLSGSVTSTIDLIKLLQLRLQQGRDQTDDLPEVGVSFDNRYEGEGEYERDDRLTARVTARVVEVKPNGNLLLEARTTVRTDDEEKVILVSGVARTEDVTAANSVLSNQMYDLRVDIQHAGRVKEAADKGIVSRVLDTLFAF
jgi:flagellar L-ring protein FlgH